MACMSLHPVHRLAIILIVAIVLPAWPASGIQDEPDDPPIEQPQQADPEREAESDDDQPSLDDLLGIDEDESAATADEIARREVEAALQRELDEAELRNGFAIALEKMGVSAELLDVAFDPGLGTQRVQEEVLARLDHLIDQARKMERKSSGSSSSSNSRRQQQQQRPGPQQGQPQQNQSRQRRTGDGQATVPPPGQEGDINTIFEESRTEWGNLPQRVRDMLLQGRREKFSSLYEQLTREYYRRLAEEGSS